jgi:glyoxylase-like metal-dependent hydrolase (beta-lactamase superfamily II)
MIRTYFGLLGEDKKSHEFQKIFKQVLHMQPNVEKISQELSLITLYPPIRGFRDFIGVWLYRGEKTFLVDVGPSATADGLLWVLQELKLHQLDYILLTHIHLDHAGGIGDIVVNFPETPVICHSAGIPHLIDPARLWQGTVKTLGDTGRSYGQIKAVPERCLIDAEGFSSDTIVPIITPGHSPHHVSFKTEKYMFAGETGGVSLSLPEGGEYMRPATPPRFLLDVSINSIDKLISCNPSRICYGHFGMRNNAVEMLTRHRNQLLLWNEIIGEEMKNFSDENFYEICIERLFHKDFLLKGFSQLDAAAQERERFFLKNSIKGFAEYLNSDKGS